MSVELAENISVTHPQALFGPCGYMPDAVAIIAINCLEKVPLSKISNLVGTCFVARLVQWWISGKEY